MVWTTLGGIGCAIVALIFCISMIIAVGQSKWVRVVEALITTVANIVISTGLFTYQDSGRSLILVGLVMWVVALTLKTAYDAYLSIRKRMWLYALGSTLFSLGIAGCALTIMLNGSNLVLIVCDVMLWLGLIITYVLDFKGKGRKLIE